MKILTINETAGTILYSSRDYKQATIFVSIYGLQTKQFDSYKEAFKDNLSNLEHYAQCEGFNDENGEN